MSEATGDTNHHFTQLTSPSVEREVTEEAVLCFPVGACEQHGPHLPLHTDTAIAEGFTRRLVSRYGDRHELWQLPALPYGISPEHAWAPGTISLSAVAFLGLVKELAGEYLTATASRRLLIVNGHGGNRGVLEVAVRELRAECGVSVCVLHPTHAASAAADLALPDVHAGLVETSLMLALRPGDVHLDRLPPRPAATGRAEVRRFTGDRSVTWPWSSGDDAVATDGIVGADPRGAHPALGRFVLTEALNSAGPVLEDLGKAPLSGRQGRNPHESA